MTAMERLTQEVERGLQRWCDEPLQPLLPRIAQDARLAQDEAVETGVVVYHTGVPEDAERGIRYQRCGGGRRIIRKKIGGY